MLFPSEVRAKLEELGAEFVSEDLAYIPVKATYSTEILEYQEIDTTPYVTKLKQNIVRNLTYRNVKTFEYYGIQGILRKVCIKYRDPIINFKVFPLRVRNVVLHMFSGRLTGEIVNRFENYSKEGQEGYYKTWRWKSCPTSEDSYSWYVVEGSADLKSDWYHRVIEEETNRLIATVRQITDIVKKNGYVEITASFETTGLIDVIWSLLMIFISGRVSTRDGYDITISYKWKGETQTVKRHIDGRVVLPVEGSVGVAWD